MDIDIVFHEWLNSLVCCIILEIRKMKVLFVIHHLKMGGAETIVTNYALQMKKMGIEVAVLDIWHFNTILFRKLQNANIPVFSIFKESNIITRIINHLYPSKRGLMKE